MSDLTRRQFLRVSALTGAATVAAACVQPAPVTTAPEAPPAAAPPTPEPTAGAPVAAPGTYQEAPMLGERVAAGELPPVDERLPENPFVIEGLDGIGNYGGTMRKSFSGQADQASLYHMNMRGLININQDFLIHPYLAESWEMNAEATEYTFRLRKGLKWSDGAPLTTEDVRFWYEDVILNRELTNVHPQRIASIVDGERVPAELTVADDLTFTFTFARPNALFYYWDNIILNIPASPKHYMSQFHKDYAAEADLARMVADGQYDDWTQLYLAKDVYRFNVERPVHYPWVPMNSWTDEFVTAERNPYFWEVDTAGNQLPYIDKVTYRVFSDRQVSLMWTVGGEIDCQARHLSFGDDYTILKENEAAGDYTVQLWKQPVVAAAHFNQTCKDARLSELFQQRDFRIAVSLCVNRDEMRELLMDGFCTNRQYTPPQESPFYYEKLANAYIEYDPDRSNALLDGLGYTERDAEGYRLHKDGSGERLSIVYIGGADIAQQRMSLMLIDYFKAIGIELNLRGMDRALQIEMHHANEVQMTTTNMDQALIPMATPVNWTAAESIDARPIGIAWTAWYMDPTNPIAEQPPEGHWIYTIWQAWEELQSAVGEEKQKEVFWRILDVWAEELPAPGFFGDFPRPVVVKNGFKGIHEGYNWDCCTTIYEYVIDDATWYWEEPEQHTD